MRDDRPFGDAEKEVFVRILKRLVAFYAVRVVSYAFMSNIRGAQTGRHPFADAVARIPPPVPPT